MKNRLKLLLALSVVALLASCNPKTYQNINYFQDIQSDTTMRMAVNKGIVIQPQDQLSIVVSHRDPELAATFNLPLVTYLTGSELASGRTTTNRLVGYVVNSSGDITFPVLGEIHVAGLTRWELQELIRDELNSNNLLKDAIVSVEFMNFKVSVVGEVSRPGTFSVAGDKITLLGALSMAGDLTIYGRRDNVQVVREKNGQRIVYVVDLRSSDLFNSPAFYLQQNDMVYVEPNNVRAGQSTINENYFRSARFWMSLGSTMMSAASLIVTIVTRVK